MYGWFPRNISALWDVKIMQSVSMLHFPQSWKVCNAVSEQRVGYHINYGNDGSSKGLGRRLMGYKCRKGRFCEIYLLYCRPQRHVSATFCTSYLKSVQKQRCIKWIAIWQHQMLSPNWSRGFYGMYKDKLPDVECEATGMLLKKVFDKAPPCRVGCTGRTETCSW